MSAQVLSTCRQVAQADDHCKWCKCLGCGWCPLALPGATPSGHQLQVIAKSSTSADQEHSCSSSSIDDVTWRDCSSFCSASSKRDHCPLCKCKACGFCTCTSTVADDADEEQCQDWCSSEYYDSHCALCKVRCGGGVRVLWEDGVGGGVRGRMRLSLDLSLTCDSLVLFSDTCGLWPWLQCKGCDFCNHGPSCFSSVEGDSDYATCETFCSAEYADSHCHMCKCRSCTFCLALAPTLDVINGKEMCSPSGVDDVHVLDCQDFCSEEFQSTHCTECKCKGCPFCQCTSEHTGDSHFAECADWCSVDFFGNCRLHI